MTILVGSVMTHKPPWLAPEKTVEDARLFLGQHGVRHIPIVDIERLGTRAMQEILIGIVSDGDVRRAWPSDHAKEDQPQKAAAALRQPLLRVMSRRPHVVHPDLPIADAAETMIQKRIDCLPVLEDGKMVGLITTVLLIRLLVRGGQLEAAGVSADVMQPELVTVAPGDHFEKAVTLIRSRRLSHLAVIDQQGHLQGILSDREVLQQLPALTRDSGRFAALGAGEGRYGLFAHDPDDYETRAQFALPVSNLMTRDVASATPQTPVANLAELMLRHQFGCVPILHNGTPKLAGIVTQTDLLRRVIELARS